MEIYPIPGFSEPFSCFTHLFATIVFIPWGWILIRRGRGSRVRVVSLTLFVFATLLMLSMSGVYHLLSPGGAGRAVLARLDHAAIFVLIAGTFTPPHCILFRGVMRWGMLLVIWSIAITAITLKSIFFADFPEWLGLCLYLGMGWMGVVSGWALLKRYGFKSIRMLLWGGIAYSVGAVFDFARAPILITGVVGPHELFHVAVLVGLVLHWRWIYGWAHWEIAR